MITRPFSAQSAPPALRASRTPLRIVFVTPHPLTRQHARTWGLLTNLAQSGRFSLTALALCRTTAEMAATIQFRRFGVETFALPDDTPPRAESAPYDSAPHLRATLERVIARGDVAIVHIVGERLAPLTRDLAAPVVWDIAESARVVQRLSAQTLRTIDSPYDVEAMCASASVIVADKAAAVALLAARQRANRSHLTLLPPVSPGTPTAPTAPTAPTRQPDPQPPALPPAMRVAVRPYLGIAPISQQNHSLEKPKHDLRVCIIPNGVDIGSEPISARSARSARSAYQPAQVDAQAGSQRAGILMTGDFGSDLWANGIAWLLRDVALRLWRLCPDLPMTLVGAPGSTISPALRALLMEARRISGGRIRLIESAADIRPYAQRAALAVVPVAPDARPTGAELSRAHTSALTTMALGLPTMLTPPALAGLMAAPGRDLLVATSADRLVALIARVLGDRELWGLLAHNGRAYVERSHSWRQSAAQLEALYERILLAAKRPTRAASEGSASPDWQTSTTREDNEDVEEMAWNNTSATRPLQVSAILAELHAQDAASEASQSQWNFVGAFRNPGNTDATAPSSPPGQPPGAARATIRSALVSSRRLSRWR